MEEGGLGSHEDKLPGHGLAVNLQQEGGPAQGDMRGLESPDREVQVSLLLSPAGIEGGPREGAAAVGASEAGDPAVVRGAEVGAMPDEGTGIGTRRREIAGGVRAKKLGIQRPGVLQVRGSHPSTPAKARPIRLLPLPPQLPFHTLVDQFQRAGDLTRPSPPDSIHQSATNLNGACSGTR